MKLTKKIETEITQFLQTYWETYMSGDITKWKSFLPENYKNIGTNQEEIWNSKNEILEYTNEVLDQMVGKAEIRNKKVQIIPYDPYIMTHELGELYVRTEKGWIFYAPIRLSSLIQKKNSGWIVLHQHGSFPDSKTQKGEAFAVDVIKAENIKLQKAVKKRTLELEQKNRELEIESSLERVRAIAMGMQKSEDLLSICKIVFEELQALGFTELRNTLITVFVDEENYFTNYDYSFATGGNSVEIPFRGNPTMEKFIKVIRKSDDAFSQLNMKGKELKDWKAFRKTNKEYEDKRLDDAKSLHYYNYSVGSSAIGISTYSQISKEKQDLLQRFRNVFQLSYKRYKDISQAEAQARESEIELALERVRARTMAMQNSDELQEASYLLDEQVRALGIKTWGCAFHIYGEKNSTEWFGNEAGVLPTYTVPRAGIFKEYYQKGQNGESLIIKEFSGKACVDHYEYMSSLPVIGDVLKNLKKANNGFPTYQLDHVVFFKYGYLLFITKEHVPESHDIFKRFAKVFEQTYTRFLDLQKAEAQAREAKIETALEKVRSRSLAMQNSDELKELIGTVYKELNNLDMALDRCLIWIMNDNDYSTRLWMANREAEPVSFFIQNHKNPPYKAVLKGWKERDTNWKYHLKGKVKKEWDNFVFTKTEMKQFPETLKKMMQTSEQSVMSGSFHSFGCLQTAGHSSLSEEQSSILTRFAKVFNQAYTRFSDLKKAEAQAREAQIETALEKVRSRTMAMQKGEELQDVVVLLYKELIGLGVTNFATCGYVEVNEKTKRQATWVTSPGGDSLGLFYLPLTGDVHFDARYDAWKKQQTVFHQTVARKERRKHLEFAITTFNSKEAEEMVLNQFPDPTVFYCFNFSHGYLHLVCGSELNKEEESLLARFTKIFEQTYARFLDLKKAEEQAREAEIELALERVRARSMAMQNSEELKEVIQVLYEQFVNLNIHIEHAGFILDYKENDDMHIWLADEHAVFPEITLPYFDCAHWNSYNEAKKKGQNFFTNQLDFEEKNKFYKDMFEFLPELPEETKATYFKFDALAISTVLLDSIGLYIENYSGTPFSDEENKILMRFGKVFQQTYTRFLDLQKAEAQAREAQIEASLERVRSQAMAMQTSDDLINSTSILFEELEKLKLNIQRSGIGIFDSETKDCHLWTTVVTKKGKKELVTGITSLTIHPMLIGTFDAWKKQESYPYILKGKELEDYYRLVEKSDFHLSKKTIGKSTSLTKEYYLYTPFGAGGLYLFSDVEPSESDKQIIKRFAEVFHLTYTRYEDLQKAEARAREAQIELALERIRSRSMAMHNSDELREAGALLFNEITKLGIKSITSGYVILEEDKKIGWNYMADPSTGKIMPFATGVFHDKTDNMRSVIKNWKKQEPVFVIDMDEQQTIDHQTFIAKQSINFPISAEELIAVSPAQLKLHAFNFKQGYLLNIGGELLTEDQIEIMLRFTKVFQQTYTRFLDLQKAEAQAREAQIEMALEKVRSRTMAMQHSNELPEAANVLFMEVQGLGIPAWSAGYNILSNDKKSAKCIMSSEGEIQAPFILPLTEHSSLIPWHKSIKSKDTFFEYEQGGKDLIEHYKYMSSLPELEQVFKQFKDAGISLPTHQINHLVKFTNGFLLFITYEKVPEAHDIFKRFGKVFEQTYTRFLDLQNAEAQTRQAQINLAVERVRAKALAMHKSEEIMEVVAKLKDEVMSLDIPDVVAATILLNEGEDKVRMWDLSSLEKNNDGFEIPFDITFKLKSKDPHLYVKRVWENPDNYFLEKQEAKDFKRIIAWLRENDKTQIADEVEEFVKTTQLKRLHHAVKKLNNGKLVIDSLNEPSDEMETILTKMGAAFDLAYKRFEDLQKAEAQAREAQIEAALEKVRSRSLAMHTTDELQEVVATVAEKLKDLGVIFDAGGVILCTYFPDNKDVVHWIAVDDFSTSGRYLVPYFDNAIFSEAWDSKIRGDAYYSKEFPVEAKNHFFEHAFEHSDYKHMPKDYKEFVLQADKHHLSAAWSKNSAIIIPSLTGAIPSESDAEIIKRFAKVFEQAYIRFMDLQKAEVQARESLIEASLERVRSRTLAMQNSEELAQTSVVVFQQLLELGIAPNRLFIGIVKDSGTSLEAWATNEDGSKLGSHFTLQASKSKVIKKMLTGWKQQKKSLVIDLKGKELQDYFQYLNKEMDIPFIHGLEQKRRVQTIAYFSGGLIGMAAPEEQPEETIKLLERFAAVFNLTYTRFNDLKVAEAQTKKAEEDLINLQLSKKRAEEALSELQLTQTQLIQSEKMASLGELTAGIAHEIQNPLNFVNNFSEVSKELLDEMLEEMENGDMEEVKAIMADVIQNLEKINHHGKRADGIVKGMLQHSRSSSGTKEPTNINALADEYLRLAYHGLRAKDKSFNATLVTDFDETIGKINIIPQDIGRVVLNLLTNAFYIVNEKKQLNLKGYQPTVTLTTKKNNNKVTISVKDNGNGIPKKVLEKIFQPFFTTKPTGQGTGLGLSMSYDIISKGHGGELKVETKEGEGTEFIILIPATK